MEAKRARMTAVHSEFATEQAVGPRAQDPRAQDPSTQGSGSQAVSSQAVSSAAVSSQAVSSAAGSTQSRRARHIHPARWLPLDGLRALAVTVVVLYHAGVHQVAGGLLGVDVFFVLSGYLITSLLFRESAA